MTHLSLAVFAVLLLSALCSGTEAALFSVPLLHLRQMAATNKRSAVLLLRVRKKMAQSITAIVIINNLANIGGSIYVGHVASVVLGDRWLGAFSAVLTFAVIVFSEIIPKTIGEHYAMPIALLAARPLLVLTKLLYPIIWTLEMMMRPFIDHNKPSTVSEAKIKFMAQLGLKEGVIEDDESVMIHRVFELNDLTAADIMTPRVVMTYLEKSRTLDDARHDVLNSQHTRIVVVDDTPDNVVGVVLKSDLLRGIIGDLLDSPVEAFMKPPLFVPSTKRADGLLEFFQENQTHLAIVTDEFGGIAGVVTLEDVLEVLTGEIVDETDQAVDLRDIARRRRERYGLSEKEEGHDESRP